MIESAFARRINKRKEEEEERGERNVKNVLNFQEDGVTTVKQTQLPPQFTLFVLTTHRYGQNLEIKTADGSVAMCPV